MKLKNGLSGYLSKGKEIVTERMQNTKGTSLGVNFYKMRLIGLLLLIVVTALPSVCGAAAYYINPASGNDSSNGSSSSPWRTINKAKSSVSAGDVVNLLPGNYGTVTFTSSDRRGTSSNYITYQNAPGNAPYAAKFSRIFFSGNTDFYITVSGFDIENTGSSDACVKVEYGSYVNIIDCKAHGQPGGNGPTYANIFTRAADHILIEDCEIYYSRAHAIQLESSDSVTVRGCHVHDIVSSGIRTGGGQNYVIENNIVHDQRADWNPSVHGSGISIHSHNTTISGNIVYNYGNSRPIFFYHQYAGPDGYTNMLVENNLVYKTTDFTGTQWWCEFIDLGENCVFRNNTFIGEVTMTFAANANGSGLSLYNNVISGRIQIEQHDKWSRVSESNNIYGDLSASGCGWVCHYDKFSPTSNSIIVSNFGKGVFFESLDSHYPYTNGYPYQLCQGSTAINFASSNYDPPTDLLGNSRVGAPDAGCYEYGGTTTTPPPDPDPDPDPTNDAPVANAGPDQTVSANGDSAQVTLDASGSYDSDGSVVSYIWSAEGSQVSGINPVVTVPEGEYTITLTVTDDGNLTDTDTVTINVVADDSTPPTIVSVTASKNSLEILFSEPLNVASAENVNNYQVDNGITITQASYNSNTVVLTTSDHTEEVQYALACVNVSDLAGNVMDPAAQNYTCQSTMMGYWKFDENTGTTTEDSSSSNNTATLVNGTAWTQDGAITLDGTNDYVNCGNGSSLNLTGSLTISASINPRSFGQAGWGRIVDKTNGSTGFSFFLGGNYGSLVYVIYGGNLAFSNANVIELNKWQHVATVYDDVAGTVTFYVDGVQVGSTNSATPPKDSSDSPMVIGIRGSDFNRAFDGSIDNVRVFNRALTATEIGQLIEPDSPFAFLPIGDKEVDENENLTFDVVTQIPDVTIELTDHTLPSTPDFTDNTFSWTPDADDAGSYEATFVAPHGELEDVETITITVKDIDRAPLLAPIGNKTVDQGEPLTFSITGGDPDGDTVTYSAINLPAGASLNSGAFSWTPQQPGSYQMTFIITAGQLTDSETITITVNGTNPGLVGFWEFNENSGTTTADSSSNNNTGTLVNGPARTQGSLTFDGTDDYVSCGSDSSLNLTGSLTISASINPSAFGQAGWGRIVDKSQRSAGFTFFVRKNTGALGYVIYGGNLAYSDSDVIGLNKWQHVAVVYDEAASTVTFYVDGVQAGTQSYTTPPKDSSGSPLVIGIRGYDSNRAFEGAIDNVRVYNRALSAQEITQIVK